MAASRWPLLASLLLCVHEQLVLICLLIYCGLTRREGGRCLLYLDDWSGSAAAAEGTPASAQTGHRGRNTVPLRTAWDSRPERMAEFPAINPRLPNVLIRHMHSTCTCRATAMATNVHTRTLHRRFARHTCTDTAEGGEGRRR